MIPGWCQLLDVVQLSSMWRVLVYVALHLSGMNSSALLVGRPDRVTQEVGRVGLMGKEWWRRE